MIAQHINLKRWDWDIYIYYNVDSYNLVSIDELLSSLGCPRSGVNDALRTLQRSNTGCTFTNTEEHISLVFISRATSRDLFINTAIHEIDHVLSHICEYYGVDLSSETAAYMIGNIVMRMYKILKLYV